MVPQLGRQPHLLMSPFLVYCCCLLLPLPLFLPLLLPLLLPQFRRLVFFAAYSLSIHHRLKGQRSSFALLLLVLRLLLLLLLLLSLLL